MKILLILLWILLALLVIVALLLIFLRVGGVAEFGQAGLKVWVRAGPIRIQVLPRRPRKKKKPKPKQEEPPPAPAEDAPPKRGGRLQQFMPYVPLVLDAAGKVVRCIQMDDLRLDFIAAGEADVAALTFGRVNALLGALLPALNRIFVIRKHRIRTAVDYQAENVTLYLYASLSARLGALVLVGLGFLLRAIKLRNQRKAETAGRNTMKAGN